MFSSVMSRIFTLVIMFYNNKYEIHFHCEYIKAHFVMLILGSTEEIAFRLFCNKGKGLNENTKGILSNQTNTNDKQY